MKLINFVPCAWSREQGFQNLQCRACTWREPDLDPWVRIWYSWRRTWRSRRWKRRRSLFQEKTGDQTTGLCKWRLWKNKYNRWPKWRRLPAERTWRPASWCPRMLLRLEKVSEAPASQNDGVSEGWGNQSRN